VKSLGKAEHLCWVAALFGKLSAAKEEWTHCHTEWLSLNLFWCFGADSEQTRRTKFSENSIFVFVDLYFWLGSS